MNRHLVLLRATAVLLFAGVAGAAESHPFSVHDMLGMHRISDQHVAPDASRIVFVRRTTDLDANRGRTDLWLVNLDGRGLRRLTSHPAGDWNPRWSRDGMNIWFLSTRSGSAQVWRIAVDGGEATQVTDWPLDVGTLAVSPTGDHLAVSMEVFPGATPADTKTTLDGIAAAPITGRIYDRMFIRHWDTWKDGRRAHVFVLPVGGREGIHAPTVEAGRAVDVMLNMDADCPVKPFGGAEDYTFTPDGRSIVFTARDVGTKEPWSTDFDLYVAPIDGSKAPRCITSDNEAWDANPVFSPDGKWLAYLAMERPGYESDRFVITLMSWPVGGQEGIHAEAVGGREGVQSRADDGVHAGALTSAWDRSPGSITWSNDGGTIFATASNLGQRSLFAIDTKSSAVRTLVRDGSIGGVQVAGDRVVYGLDTLRAPVELFSVAMRGGEGAAITRVNADRVAAGRMGDFEQFTFRGWNDEEVHGYLVKPVDFDAAKKYPVAFLIHGGPQGSFGNHFHYRWNPQAYAGAGYAAVMIDFHGSTGYGQAFCDSIRGDWGGKPLVDLQKGLAAALERYPWLDGDRVAALGASFGGFMINWIAGNWSDRFRCLVNHDGNLDERLAYYNTEELWFPEWDHHGTPWDNPEGYAQHNPIDFVKNWRTPMLVVHGALDYRVVDTQGMSTFTALQRRGIPSKFLYFPDENHWVLQPANSILWHGTVMAWLDQWTKR